MQVGSPPLLIPVPWASAAGAQYIQAVPTTSQIGIVNGMASWPDGFPPLNMTDLAVGGVPPYGQVCNGALNQISAGLQWLQAGGPMLYNAAFATSIGGYAKGATISSTTYPYRWLCTTDNNVSNPDAGGSGWALLVTINGMAWLTTTQSWTIPASQIYFKVWGGGGGGGGCSTSNFGTGGGGAGYSEGLVTGLTLGASLPITVGAGASGGSSGGGNGGVGNTSAVSSYITCTGGNGGAGNGDGFGAAGTGTGGSINFSGVPGGFGITSGGSVIFGGFGGSSFCGPFNVPGTNSNGGNGLYPGVGGNGAGSNSGSFAGGPGANGLIIASW